MFLRQIIEAFLVLTEPDSSMVKPAHIHITSTPQTKNENVLKTNDISSALSAKSTDGCPNKNAGTTSNPPTETTGIRLINLPTLLIDATKKSLVL